MDISEKQISYARKLAKKENVKAPFYIGNMEDLKRFDDESFDIVLSSFAISYAENLRKTFQEVFRILRNSGFFVFAEVHPVACRGRIARKGKSRAWVLGNYFDRRKRRWAWNVEEGVATFYGSQRTIQDYFDALLDAGFVVEKLLELEPYTLKKMNEAEEKEIPYTDAGFIRDYDIWHKTPYTIIIKARKIER